MLDVPTIVKILKFLRSNPSPVTYKDIISIIQAGQVYIDKALEKLIAEDIVRNEGGSYFYNATPKAEDFCQKLFALYDKLIKRPQLELLVRGILCQLAPRYLLKMETLLEVTEREGFKSSEVTQLLEEELSKGYLRRVRLIFIAKASLPSPVYLPSYYLSHSREVGPEEWQKLEEYSHNLNLSLNEVDYLAASYPVELAEPAIQYLEKEKKEVRDALREAAFQQWYGARYLW